MDELKIQVTKEDIDRSAELTVWLAPVLGKFNIKLSALCTPLTTSYVRTHKTGFPLMTADEIIVIESPEADTLRSLYERLDETRIESFITTAIPLFLKLRADNPTMLEQEVVDAINRASAGK